MSKLLDFVGSDTFKNGVSLVAILASGTAAFFSHQAEERASQANDKLQTINAAFKTIELELKKDDQKHNRNELATTLIRESLPYLHKMRSEDSIEALTACQVVVTYSILQLEVTNRTDIHDLAMRITEKGVQDPSGLCVESQNKAKLAQLVVEQEKSWENRIQI